ncbi:MAG: hypothetical protein RL538_439 [Candidatus Parcubacteria bacterium]|jgi:hypothetical protein
MKLIQTSCLESNKIDTRQAEAVARHQPDVIIFESPMQNGSYEDVCNGYPPDKKPVHIIRERMKILRKVAKKYPWVLSDIQMYEHIIALWRQGHDVKLYHVDGPSELLHIHTPGSNQLIPSRRGTYLMWWVRIFLRETYIAKNIGAILKKYKQQDVTILVFLQKFHWINVQFRLKNPSKRALWDFYFGRYKNLDKVLLNQRIRDFNKTLYTYWTKDTTLK